MEKKFNEFKYLGKLKLTFNHFHLVKLFVVFWKTVQLIFSKLLQEILIQTRTIF